MIKLVRGIDRDPLELVRYAESECQAWFNANEIVPSAPQAFNIEEPQVLNLGNICMIDESWTSMAQFSGCVWVWMNNLGNVQLMETRSYPWRESALHSCGSITMSDREYAPTLDISHLWDGLQRFDRCD